jgi:hypothetical protein
MTMTVHKSSAFAVGAGICKVGLVFIGLGLFIQILDNFFYRQPFDRLFALGLAFILTSALCRTFRVMNLKGARLARSANSRVDYNDPREMSPRRIRIARTEDNARQS